MDIVDKQTRSRMMSGIRGKNTRPEIAIRKELFKHGFRYRLHADKLPGKPDIILPKYKAAVFVNGCFWHMHDCSLFKMPTSNVEFWKNKLERNRESDARLLGQLAELGWRILIIWECSFRGKGKMPLSEVGNKAAEWLKSDSRYAEIRGAKE